MLILIVAASIQLGQFKKVCWGELFTATSSNYGFGHLVPIRLYVLLSVESSWWLSVEDRGVSNVCIIVLRSGFPACQRGGEKGNRKTDRFLVIVIFYALQ